MYAPPWTKASVPMRIQSSFRSGINCIAIPIAKTRAKIGSHKIIQRRLSDCSPVKCTVCGEKSAPRERNARKMSVHQRIFLYFSIQFSRGERNLFICAIMENRVKYNKEEYRILV
jgi:hypothetical protein